MQGESRYWIEWLPAEVSQEAKEHEPARFKAVVEAIVRAQQAAAADGKPGAWHSITSYIPLLNNLLDTKQVFPTEHVIPLVHSLLAVVYATSHDLEVQVRVAECVCKILHQHKKVLSKPLYHDGGGVENGGSASQQQQQQEEGPFEAPKLVLPWRPLFELMMSLYGNPPPVLEGLGLSATRQANLSLLVTRCRRYFEPGAVLELWQLLGPGVACVSHTTSDAYEALGWLALFAPTNNLNRIGEAAANQLLGEWMAAWSKLACAPSWDTLWAGLIGRMAKHDWKGFLDWRPYLPRLFTVMMGAVEVPVGTASSAPAIQRPPPSRAVMLFNSLVTNFPSHLARLSVHLLRACPQRPATQERAAAAASHLQQLAALLDNYLHPSNTGRWSKELAAWLGRAVEEFMHQVGKQGPKPWPWTAYIDPATQDMFVELATSLAARGQFSKDQGLSDACVTALSQLAYVRPERVLPLVVQRFRAALESSTATHQLCAAISCLAHCVRPMLLSGWGLPEEPGPQLLAEALVALLPGIDANDELKTLAVIHLFVAVLGSAPGIGTEGELPEGLPEQAVRIPVYADDWADDVAGRITQLLANLDTGLGHRSTDAAGGRSRAGAGSGGGGGLFLHGPNSLFSNLIELLVSRLAPDIARSVASRIAKFGASEVLPGVESAVSAMLAEAACYHPDVLVADFVQPVLSKLNQELGAGSQQPGSAAAGTQLHEISRTTESIVTYQMSLLCAVVWHLPWAHVQQLTGSLRSVADASFAVASRHVQDSGSLLLRALCHACVNPQLRVQTPQLLPLGPGGALLLEWIDREGHGADKLGWVLPPAEGPALAEQLLSTYLTQPAAQLCSMLGVQAGAGAAAGAGAGGAVDMSDPHNRMRAHAELMKMKAVLSGLLSHLTDFEFEPGGGGTPVYLAGAAGPLVGSPAVREQLSLQLAGIGAVLHAQPDSEALAEFLVLCELVLCVGSLDYVESRTSERAKRGKALLEEPSAAGVLINANLQTAGGALHRPWRKRITLLAAVRKTYDVMLWRSSQRAFRWWATDSQPCLTHITQLTPGYVALLQCVVNMATHPLRPVRSEALATFSPVLVRFGFLAQHTLPQFFAAIAGIPPPASLTHPSSAPTTPSPSGQDASQQSAGAAAGTNEFVEGFSKQLLAAAFRGVVPPAGEAPLMALPTPPAEEGQGERDARVEGAVQALAHNLPFWRLMLRDVGWHTCLMYCLMASRVHNSTVAQGSLGTLFINVLSRYLMPPTLTYSQPAFTQLANHMLHLAHPDTLRASWRYSLAANVLCLVLQPPPSAGPACLPFTNHLMHHLLQPGCMLQLGKLAMAGLSLALTRMMEFGETNSQLASDVESWLQQPITGPSLAVLLASDHATLDAQEGSRDTRGGAPMQQMSRLLNMTHEELLLKVVAASYDRLSHWPEGGTSAWQPEGVQQGLFVVSHAQLVHLLGLTAPAATEVAFRQLLDKCAASAAAPITTSDKAEQATAAEVTAGLLAAGLPPVSSATDNTWLLDLTARQLQACTLEMSEAWAVTLRYAVYGLMDVTHPAFNIYKHVARALAAPGAAPASLSKLCATSVSPQQAVSHLGAVLQLARSAGPVPAALAPRPSPAGEAAGTALAAGHGEVLKRLRFVHQCAREMLAYRLDDTLPAPVLSFWLALADDLTSVIGLDVVSMRQQLGKMMGLFIMHAADAAPGSAPGGMAVDTAASSTAAAAGGGGDAAPNVAAVRAAAIALQTTLLAAFAAGTGMVQALKQQGVATADKPSGSRNGNGNGNAHGEGNGGSEGGASSLSDIVMVERPPSPVALDDTEPTPTPSTITEANPKPSPMATAPSPAGNAAVPGASAGCGDRDVSAVLSDVGLGLGLLSWASFHGDLVQLQAMLLDMLPQVFRLQELAGPMLQKLAHDARFALALAKYWPLASESRSLEQVLACLEAAAAGTTAGAGGIDPWSTRAAALSYAQYWWFRTCFLLPQPLATRLQSLVLARLADSKPEVRSMAGATLSGMLRGVQPSDAEKLRTHFVSQARQLLTPSRGPRLATRSAAAVAAAGDATAAASTLLQRHAVVQGLTAFLQSSPYDCPPWTPQVLLALVRPAAAQHGSGIDAAVRSAAAKALSDFKRTHEQDSMDVLRAMMSEDEWDSLQQATSSSSYFT